MALSIPKRTPRPQSEGDSPSLVPMIRRPATVAAVRPSNGQIKFVDATQITTHHRLIVSDEGEEKTGKNHFAFTAPGPIYEHSFDIGNEGVISKFIKEKKIYVAEYELEIQPGEAPDQEVAVAADKVWAQFIANFKDGLASCGNGTTFVDTGTEMWELLRLARFGKLTQVMPHHYGPVNKEMQEAIRECFSHNCNVIFSHKMKDEWENYTDSQGREKGKKTGRKVRVGFNDMPFLVQVNVTSNRVDIDGGGSEFTVHIDDCRQNADLNGVDIPNDFELLLGMVFGE